jgi:hypothetical protein
VHVTNADLRRELSAYQAALRSDPSARVPEALGSMILSLCVHLAERPNFSSYTFKEDMIGAAALICVRAAARIDLTRGSSVFSYLTSCAWRAFVDEIKHQGALGFSSWRSRTFETPTLVPLRGDLDA